jgi:predicted RNA-binding protein with PUA-like domain
MWLFKEEPTNYSYDALVRDGQTTWTGVRNPLAQKHLRAVAKGDRIFFYHTGSEKSVVGIMQAAGETRASGDAGGNQGRQVVRDVCAGAAVTIVRDACQRRRVGADRENGTVWLKAPR